jgi:hypothetical protein
MFIETSCERLRPPQKGHLYRATRAMGSALRQEGHVYRATTAMGSALHQEGHVYSRGFLFRRAEIMKHALVELWEYSKKGEETD